jgi:hypothetical protein
VSQELATGRCRAGAALWRAAKAEKSLEPAGWKACSTTKKPPDPGKTENEGIQRILAKTVRQAGLILLFDGEVDPAPAGPDEHSQTGILTSASNRLPAFPIRFGGTLGNL